MIYNFISNSFKITSFICAFIFSKFAFFQMLNIICINWSFFTSIIIAFYFNWFKYSFKSLWRSYFCCNISFACRTNIFLGYPFINTKFAKDVSTPNNFNWAPYKILTYWAKEIFWKFIIRFNTFYRNSSCWFFYFVFSIRLFILGE